MKNPQEHQDWLAFFLNRCEDEHITVLAAPEHLLHPAQLVHIKARDWSHSARLLHETGVRWRALWVEQPKTEWLRVNACFCRDGKYLVLRCEIPLATPLLPSHTPIFPSANRPERHAQDLYGIVFSDHPDHRRWTRHHAWNEDTYPLRLDFPKLPEVRKESPPDNDYPFFRAQGSGVYEIPVGPVHAGIIEPGHFRFQAVGETILNLEERLGYVHKGIEKIAEGRDPVGLARLAGRVSGDSTVAHAWAACQAMERAAGVELPKRALALRAILAERERIANHLGDIGAICNDVGFAFAQMQCSRLREDWLRDNQAVFGHRLLMDLIVPGGVNIDPTPEGLRLLAEGSHKLKAELDQLLPILEDNPSLEDRLLGTGILSTEIAESLGVTGYLGKASGMDYDVRRDHGYAPYDQLKIVSPCLQSGDVAARLQIRANEISHSLDLIKQVSTDLPDGSISADWIHPKAGSEGLGLVEGWRGEIITHIRFGDNGRIARFFPRDPSWLNWPALEILIQDNIVPDFPVCNKSVNGSYSGQDL